MSKIVWDKTGERYYETGVKKVVLYLMDSNGAYSTGVPWNGITAITEKPTGADANALYADDIKYLNLIAAEDFEASVEGYTYPDEFAECDGSKEIAPGVMIGQQNRKMFGLAFVSTLGNDTDLNNYGYKIHIIYAAQAAPSEAGHNTVNENPDATAFSWDIKTTPVNVTGHKPTAHLVIDSTKADAAKLAALEDILYGTTETEPRLPLPDEIATLMAAA